MAIDDIDLSEMLSEHFGKTYNLINDEQMEKCIDILMNTENSGYFMI